MNGILPPAGPEPRCEACHGPPGLCRCGAIEPYANKTYLLILQHPQEQDRELGSARLALRHVVNGRLSIGLSWPNLAKAAGRASADPRRWACLYLGAHQADDKCGITMLDRRGKPISEPPAVPAALDGIILLDGTWSQAKTLWWRNSWLLKTQRMVIDAQHPSAYGKLRREPRRDGLATLEAAAFVLGRLEGRPDLERAMIESFGHMLDLYRSRQARGSTANGDRDGGAG